MKKLMIAAAMVCAAAITQAASVTWQFTATASSKDQWVGYTVYLFDSATFNAGVNLETKALAAGLLDSALDSSTLNWYSGTAPQAKNWMYKTGPNGGNSARQIDDITGDSINWTMILVDANGKYQNLGTGTTSTYDPETEGATAATTGLAAASIAALPKYDAPSGSIPEPTSAMLMLIGAAGLALRRKRA